MLRLCGVYGRCLPERAWTKIKKNSISLPRIKPSFNIPQFSYCTEVTQLFFILCDIFYAIANIYN